MRGHTRFVGVRAMALGIGAAMVAGLVVAVPGGAGIAPAGAQEATSAPRDQAIDGDPECTEATKTTDFPGRRSLVGVTQRQSFIPSRGTLTEVQLCLSAKLATEVTVKVLEPISVGGLVKGYAEVTQRKGSVEEGTDYVSLRWPSTQLVALDPGSEYVLEVTGPADVTLPPDLLAWRMTCLPREEDLDGASCTKDRYAWGEADGQDGDADFGFRTGGPSADLQGTVYGQPRQVCPGATYPLDLSVTNVGDAMVRDFGARLDLVTADGATTMLWSDAVDAGLGPEGRHRWRQADGSSPHVTVPAGVGHGRGRLELVVDADDRVVENTGEDNNTTVVETIVTSCDAAGIDDLTLTASTGTPPVPDPSASTPTVPAGVGLVPIHLLPVANLRFRGGDLAASPYRDNPYRDNPYRDNPYRDNPYRDNPLVRAPLLAGTLNTVPVDPSRRFHDDPGNAGSFLAGAPTEVLAQVPLTTVGILRPGGWQEVLNAHAEAVAGDPSAPTLAHVPLQQLSLLDVMTLDPVPSPPLTHLDVDLDASPLSDLTIGASAMGSTPLLAIELPPDGSTADLRTRWCALLAEDGIACADADPAGVDPATATLVTIDLLGFDLARLPWDALTFDRIALAAASPLGAVPLQTAPDTLGFDPRRTPLTDQFVPKEHRDLLVDGCDACRTFGEVADALAFRAGATFAQLEAALPVPKPEPDDEQVAVLSVPEALQATTSEDTLDALPLEHAVLDDVLLSALVQDGPFVDYRLTATATASGSALVDPTFEVLLPAGASLVPGSARLEGSDTAAVVTEPTPSRAGGVRQRLEFPTDLYVPAGETVTLAFAANPGHVLTNDTAVGSLTGTDLTGTYTATTDEVAPVTVRERFEPDAADDLASAEPLPEDTLVVSHLGTPGDRDTWLIPVPPEGSELRIVLSHLPEDYDLVLSGASERAIETSPYRDNPYRHNPYRDNPYRDNPYRDNPVVPEPSAELSATGPVRATSSELLHDVPTDAAVFQERGIRAVSIGRGTSVEQIHFTVPSGETGHYVLQVSGYDRASSPRPYVLRHHVRDAKVIGLGACQPRPFDVPATEPGTLPSVADLDPDTNTLFLVHRQRLAGRWGVDARDALLAELDALAARSDLGVRGVVVPVEHDPDVATAYAAWDANRCDPLAANGVAGAIRDVVLDYATQLPLAHVVVVGDDDQVPFTRIRDGAGLGNERSFLSTVVAEVGATGVDGPANGTPLTAALQAGMFLTDDPLGSAQAKPWLDMAAWIPTLAVGRLPGDPTSTIGALQRFADSDGRLDPELLQPEATLTTGYEHLLDGGAATAQALDASTGLIGDRLLSDTWSSSDLRTSLDELAGARDPIVSLNGHADHRRFLGASGSVTSDLSDTLEIADLAGLPPGLLVFSMACHLAYDLPAVEGQQRDWTDAVTARPGVLVANTAYNYGDTETVAAGELFSSLFAANLDGAVTVGQATAYTKAQVYAREGGHALEAYKAMQGMVTFGLPMYRVATSDTVPAPRPIAAPATTTPVVEDPATGLATAELTLDLQMVPTAADCPAGADCLVPVTSDDGVHFEVVGPHGYAPIAVSGRPTGARAVLDVTGIDPGGRRVHGAVVTAITSEDLPNDPVFARAVLASAGLEPEPDALGTVYPTRPVTVTTVESPFGEHQVLTVLPWTFRSTGVEDGEVVGDLRLDTHLRIRLLLSDDAENRPPTIESFVVRRDGGDAVVTARVSSPPDRRAVLSTGMLRDQFGGWHEVVLTSEDGETWFGRTRLPGADARGIDVLGQACNRFGDCASWRNKGDLVPLAEPGELPFELAGVPGNDGWFRSVVEVRLPEAPFGHHERRDAGHDVWVPVASTFEVTGDGVHVFDLRDADGAHADDVTVPVDETPPDVTVAAPAGGTVYPHDATITVDFACTAPGPSGLQSCTGDQPVGTVLDLPPGTHTFTAVGVDGAGNRTTSTVAFEIEPPPFVYDFHGFFSPVVNDHWNAADAGTAVPFKFRLYVDGVLQTDPAVVVATRWQPVTCTDVPTDATPVGTARPTASTNNKGVYVTGQRMQIDAVVPEDAAGTCQRFELELDDGQVHHAWFTVTSSG